MRHLLAVLCVAFPSAVWAACPVGTIPSMDLFGNQTCKNVANGATESVQAPAGQCPRGAHPVLDEYGNKVCQNDLGGQRSYDTSHGCPAGFIPWPGQFGKMGCKRI